MTSPSEKSYDTAQRIDAQVAGGWTIPFEAIKSADESRTSTTLADDADLQFVGILAGTYKVELDVAYTGGAGASEGDYKWGFTWPTGATIILSGIARGTDQALHQNSYDGSASITLGTNGLSLTYGFSMRGLLVTPNSGNFVYRWACGTNTGTSSRTLTDSRLSIARRI